MAVKVGMGQMLVEGGRPKENLARAVEMIERATREGCRAVVLPECLDIGWTHGSARDLARPIPGEHADALCDAAKRAGICVAAGLVERAGNKLYNAAVLIAPDGRILRVHRKINELDIGHHLYSCGDSIAVVPTDELGTVGISICADNSPDSLAIGHALCRMGARVILSPSAWAVPPGFDNAKTPYGTMWQNAYTTLAKLYDVTVIGVSNVGVLTDGAWTGWDCIGCSLAVGPAGEVLARGPFGRDAEALLTVDLPKPHRSAPWGTTLRGELRKRGYAGP